jgi:hypothetical protein
MCKTPTGGSALTVTMRRGRAVDGGRLVSVDMRERPANAEMQDENPFGSRT